MGTKMTPKEIEKEQQRAEALKLQKEKTKKLKDGNIIHK